MSLSLSKFSKSIIIVYLILLHAFGSAALIKTDLVERIIDFIHRKYNTFQMANNDKLILEEKIKKEEHVKNEERIKQGQIRKSYDSTINSDSWAYQNRIQANFYHIIPPDSFIFIGDSIVNNLDTRYIATESVKVNMGVSGETSYGLLVRLRQMKKTMPEYGSVKVFFVHIGINDIGFGRYGELSLLKNVSGISKLIPSHSLLIISGVLPVDERVRPSEFRGYNARIASINKELKSICKTKENCIFSNSGNKLIDISGNLSVSNHLKNDPVHLSKDAYSLWQSEINSILSNKIHDLAAIPEG